MRKLRNKIGQYQEILYLIFILTMTGMTSMGINSEYRIYKYVFAAATLVLVVKMAVTDFTWQEFLVMAVLTVLLGVNLLRNGEKTLVLTAMGIFGAKNVSLEKVMKCAFWEKAVLTVGTLTAATTGIIENVALSLPKNDETFDIYCYGYYSPNMAFANIFVVLLLAILAYGDRLKWYTYFIGTGITLAAHQVFMCRTGLIIWGVLCLMVLGYRLLRHFHLEKWYMMLFCAIPAVLAALTFLFAYLSENNEKFYLTIHYLLTGRIAHINQFIHNPKGILLGCVPREPFDSIYFHLLYNYGWVLFFVGILAYCVGIWYCNTKGKCYEAIGLGIMAVYGFMEHLPLSVLWNLPLLYLAWVLFKERKTTDEQLQ